MLHRLPADLPTDVRAAQILALQNLGVDPTNDKAMADAVMTLSTFYVKNPEKSSPWSEAWTQIAYLTYYMPLNWWRLCGVVGRGQDIHFFDDFDSYIDFGSGLGSLGLAFDSHKIRFRSGNCIERSMEASELHRQLAKNSLTPLTWRRAINDDLKSSLARTLAIFSYSLTELTELPAWVGDCEGLMIIEPSTKDDARRLQKFRHELFSLGFSVWGPCTHANSCPLLTQSERDWCHDRFQWTPPSWLMNIERHMPIKNSTLPCSWLMMRKTKPSFSVENTGRLTGDLQEFKGFAKQLICRGSEREFLSWQRKNFKQGYPESLRGELVQIKSDLPKKGNEIRVSSDEDVTKLSPRLHESHLTETLNAKDESEDV